MIEQLIPLATGAAGGLVGSNILGALFKKSGVASNSLVGIIAGAVATHFFGPTYGPLIGNLIGSGGLEAIIGNLGVGAAGGGVAGLIWGIIKSMVSR
ncbi:MAG: hypothetical protein NW205_12895 [Hyphomicrobiaceae bacterium]|nr:hypothetical protein [Hyphomicrobiaceae bacterium]